MVAYAIRRLLASIPILFAASIVVFLIVSLSGDPVVEKYAGRNPPVSQRVIDLERHRLGLDKPLYEQYWTWLTNVVQLKWGPSVNAATNVGSDLGRALATTSRLVFLAMLLALVFAVLTGVVSAVRQYSKVDYFFTFLGFLFLSMPAFWIAVLLIDGAIRINLSTGTSLFQTLGAVTPNMENASAWARFADIVGHLILPTISLSLITYAAWSRFQRASMLEVLNSDYVRLARAKGLSSRKVLVRHALRTALIPMTTVSALGIAAIFGGAVITETVFSWRGMGQLLISSVYSRDRNMLLGWLMITGFIVIIGNLIADLLYGVLDPRIRYE
jgi:peptide/nickel transport system permease protein